MGGGLSGGGQAEHSSLLPASERVRCHWGEFRDGGEESRERGEKRQMVLPGDSCSSQSTPTVQAPALFSLPPSGLLEGLSLSPSFPESCVLTLEALGALSAQDGSVSILLTQATHLALWSWDADRR